MTTAGPSAATQAPSGGRALLVGLLTSVLAIAFESVAVATAMPRAGQDLGGLGLYAWAFTLFVLGMVLATVVAGRACDAVGPAIPFIAGQLTFLVGLLAAGSASSMLMLVVARFVQGLGGGAVNLSMMVVVALAFDERRRATVMSAFSFCWVLPAFVGPLAAGWITDTWSWHWVFRAVAPVVAVAMALVLPSLRRLPASGSRHGADAAGTDRAETVSDAAAEAGAVGAPASEPSPPVPLWAAAAAGVGAAGLQYAGQRMDAVGAVVAVAGLVCLALGVPQLMPPRFLRVSRGLPAVVWTRSTMAGAFFAAESFLPLMLVQQRHLSLSRAGMALTIGSLGWTVGSWLQSRPWVRLPRERVILVGTVCQASGVLLVALFAWFPRLSLALPGLGWTLSGLGMGLGVASTSLATMTLSREADLGRNTSSLQVGEGLGNSILAGLAGSVFHLLTARVSASTTFGALYVVPALVAVLACACAGRIGPVGPPTRDAV